MNRGTHHAIIRGMKTTAIILSGGRGSRTGGEDKGLLNWNGAPIIASVISRILPQVDELIISANRNIERYAEFGYPVVGDALDDFQGPLAGIASALPLVSTDIALVVPCDSPTLPVTLVTRLLAPLEDARVDLSWVFDGSRDQYLLTVFRCGLLEGLLQYLGGGGRSVRGWHRLLNCQAVNFSDCAPTFLNLNRASDFS